MALKRSASGNPITVVKKGSSFACPWCGRMAHRVDVGRNLYLFTVPAGHEVKKDNVIVCFVGRGEDRQPYIWEVFFTE